MERLTSVPVLIGICFPVALVFSAFVSGCSLHECDEEGCRPNLAVEFNNDSSQSWDDGVWRVSLHTDGEEIGACETELPTDIRQQETNCRGDLGIRLDPDGDSINVATSHLGSTQSDALPAEVEVRLERDGESVSEQTFHPDYTSYRPNGESCPPECRAATLEHAF